MKIQEQAPAKINLALNILGRRTDGYHELRMVMQSVSLCDTVTVEETGIGFALLADGFTVPAGKSSLEQQAAEAFFAAFQRRDRAGRLSPITQAWGAAARMWRRCCGACAGSTHRKCPWSSCGPSD